MFFAPLRTISLPIALMCVSLTSGVTAGLVTVYDLAPKSYGPTLASLPYPSRHATSEVEQQPTVYEDCQDCSERDRGYHWAALQQIVSASECPNESWGFQRGCLSYTRDTGGV